MLDYLYFAFCVCILLYISMGVLVWKLIFFIILFFRNPKENIIDLETYVTVFCLFPFHIKMCSREEIFVYFIRNEISGICWTICMWLLMETRSFWLVNRAGFYIDGECWIKWCQCRIDTWRGQFRSQKKRKLNKFNSPPYDFRLSRC